jgi:hypothetical protein
MNKIINMNHSNRFEDELSAKSTTPTPESKLNAIRLMARTAKWTDTELIEELLYQCWNIYNTDPAHRSIMDCLEAHTSAAYGQLDLLNDPRTPEQVEADILAAEWRETYQSLF